MTWQQKLIRELKFWDACRPYGIGMWQCPKFLFVVMGGTTIVGMVVTYFVAVRYTEPEFVVSGVFSIAVIIFTLGFIIVQSFENMAAASRMKSEFVSIVSHQLRTPLSSTKWELDSLASERPGSVNAEQLEHISSLKQNNERMIKLVNDLLNVSKIEDGKISLNKERVNLGSFLKNAAKDFSSYAEANNVKIKTDISDETLELNLDKQYVAIILNNLLDNAVRYIKNSGEVLLKAKNTGHKVRISVKDNGVGIPAEEQKNIFQKFFRAKNALRHRTEGTGIGLYLSKAFVELHGGRMGFSSKEDEGSTFWFELPIK